MTIKNKKVIFLFGATASGKTDFLFEANKKVPCFSLINSDSIQVYKNLNIGSAKPSKEERELFKHYLIDIKEPYKTFNVSEFIDRADVAVDEIINNNKIPIISGGTAYYFKSFMYGLSNAPKTDDKTKKMVEERLQNDGLESLYEYLTKIDPHYALKISSHDKHRILRAVEVYEYTKKPLSSFPISTKPRSGFEFKIFYVKREREELKKRIETRVKKMFDMGLREEVNTLKKMGATLDWQSMKAIGYREFFLDLQSDKEIFSLICSNTYKYSKRQDVFFKTFPNAQIIDTPEPLISELLISKR